jgi:hypothetical protein
MAETLADALPNEIARVRSIQDHYKELRRLPNVIVEPQIAMMEHAIQSATRACAAGDVVEMIRWHQELKEYSE